MSLKYMYEIIGFDCGKVVYRTRKFSVSDVFEWSSAAVVLSCSR